MKFLIYHSKFSITKGFTLVEVMLAIAIFAIVTPVITTMLTQVLRGFSTYEMSTQIKKTNQKTNNRIHLRLGSCKRIFQNTTNDKAYLDRLTLSDSPSVLSGTNTKLPIIEETGSLAMGTTNFTSTSVGNSLFFAGNEATVVLESILDSSAISHTVYIDAYRFNYYYLTTDNTKYIVDRQAYKIVEWQSIKYADLNQINSISDNVKKENTIIALISSGINYGWLPSEMDVSSAFYTLEGDGSLNLSASHNIEKHQHKVLTDILTGIMGSGYRYGISPNTSGWNEAPKTVPLYGEADDDFPAGFEIAIVGQSGGRKVLIRSVLVAQGSSLHAVGDEMQHITSVRDLW